MITNIPLALPDDVLLVNEAYIYREREQYYNLYGIFIQCMVWKDHMASCIACMGFLGWDKNCYQFQMIYN